jgi:hypothetical protein
MSAENDLGMSIARMREHEYCMSENQITNREASMVIDRLTQLTRERPADWWFANGFASIDAVRLAITDDFLMLQAPVALHPWYRDRSNSDMLAVEHLINALHDIRHQYHNAEVVETLNREMGIDFRQPTTSFTVVSWGGAGADYAATVPIIVAPPVEPANDAPPPSAVAHVGRMKTMIDEIVAHPMETVGIIAMVMIVAHLFA